MTEILANEYLGSIRPGNKLGGIGGREGVYGYGSC